MGFSAGNVPLEATPLGFKPAPDLSKALVRPGANVTGLSNQSEDVLPR